MFLTKLQLPLKPKKRHLVVGDLHGRWNTFSKLLETAHYNPNKDIIYSTGDLIDRGSFSVEIVKFFMQPNTYSVLGNHEQMAYLDTWPTDNWHMNGGRACIHSLAQNRLDLNWLREFIGTRHLMIDVGNDDQKGCFRIVHADLPPHIDESVIQEMFESEMMLEHTDEFANRLLWSRDTIGKHEWQKDIVFGEGRTRTTFLGHTMMKDVTQVGNMVFIDNYTELTLIDAITKEVFKQKHLEEDYL